MISVYLTGVLIALLFAYLAYSIIKYIGKKNTKKKRKTYLNLTTGNKVKCCIGGKNEECRIIKKIDLGYEVVFKKIICNIEYKHFLKKL